MAMKEKKRTVKFFNGAIKASMNHYLLAITVVGVSALLCTPLSNTENYHVVSFILLFVVSILSTFLTIGPVLIASTLSALAWNFFFIPPHFTFKIEKTEDVLIFGLFFIIALVNGILTTRVRRQEQIAREREKRTNALFQLTKELSKASGIDEVLKVAIGEINSHFSLNPFFILQDGNNILSTTGRLQKEKKLTPAEYNVAEWVFKNGQKAGAHTNQLFGIDYTFFPLPGTRINPGVLVVKQSVPFAEEQQSYWDTFVAQISNALEREFLGELAQKVRFLGESDRLYKTLFNSISHELRIPVATILGASDSILNSANSANIQSALCTEIFMASLRLNRLIENLLNMSRLESGHISVRLDWYDINDLFNKVTEDLKDELKPFSLKITISDEMPLVKIDFGLMEQVLYNLLFNATQYAPGASDIELNTNIENGELIIEVADQGPGFPEIELKNVFKKFFRVNGSKTGGLGLGLSIVKGFVEAHRGLITVENRLGTGAKFTIRIPTEKLDIENLKPEN
jgi:two-component system sensor histidine kinase KdpD